MLLLLSVAMIALAFFAYGAKFKITPYDCIAIAGKGAKLVVKVEKRITYLNPDYKGARVEFYDDRGKPLGTASTKRDGFSELQVNAPSDPGPYEYSAVVYGRNDNSSDKVRIRVFAYHVSHEFVVTDIDHTISDFPEMLVPFRDVKKVKPLPKASETLTFLSKRYGIVYLTARDDSLLNMTREWLSMNAFPDGPVVVRDLSAWNLSGEKFKTKKLAELRETIPNFKYGFGERVEDQRAYKANGIQGFHISKKVVCDFSITVKNWAEIRSWFDKQ